MKSTKMDANLQRRIQKYGWDKASEFYEQYWQVQLQPAQDWLLKTAKVKESESVLDIASGTGLLSFPMAEMVGPSGSVLGADISERMVSISRKTLSQKGFENIRFEIMDGEELALPDNTFDLVICSLGLMYMPQPGHAIREMYRVLKPGGRMLSLVWGERKECGWSEIFPIVESRVCSGGYPLFFQLGTANFLALHMQSAGFGFITVERMKLNLPYQSGDEACGAAFMGGPVAMAYSRFSHQTRKEAHEDYLMSIAEFRSGEGYDVPGEFVLSCGFKN